MLSPSRWLPCSPLARHIRLTSDSISNPRRGRNLTERYRRLESAARAKSERATNSLLSQRSASVGELRSVIAPAPAPEPVLPDTIAGFVIPIEPRAPADNECCMSGCAVCVYDLYEEALTEYKESVTTLRSNLSALRIPESGWPAHIRHTPPTPTHRSSETSKGVVLNVFEEMERALKEKRTKRAAVEAEKRIRGDVLTGDGEGVKLSLRGVCEGIKWVVFPNH